MQLLSYSEYEGDGLTGPILLDAKQKGWVYVRSKALYKGKVAFACFWVREKFFRSVGIVEHIKWQTGRILYYLE